MATTNPSVYRASRATQDCFTITQPGVNLFQNGISTITQANPAVVVVANAVAAIVSPTGVVGSIAGSGPWTAIITGMTTTAGLTTGMIIVADYGVGSIGTGSVQITSIIGNTSIAIKAVGGTTPIAGAITDIRKPSGADLPASLSYGSKVIISGISDATLTFTQSASTGTFAVGQTITQATSGANAVITSVNYNGSSSTLGITTVEGTFDTTHLVSGPELGLPLTPIPAPTMTPTAVVGMTELLTAGENNTNSFYAVATDIASFQLWQDAELTLPVVSSAFTTATPNTGFYNTFTVPQYNAIGDTTTVIFNTTEQVPVEGNSISYDPETGIFTLAADLTYTLTATASANVAGANYLWYNVTTSGLGYTITPAPVGAPVTLVITPNVETEIKLIVVAEEGTSFTYPTQITNAQAVIQVVSGFVE